MSESQRTSPDTIAPPLGMALTLALLLGVSLAIYFALWFIDFGGTDVSHPFELLRDPRSVDMLGGMAEVTLAVVGVALTVVAIIVELAATRYTPRITTQFIRDPVNVLSMGFFALTAIIVFWVLMSLGGDHYPTAMVTAVFILLSAQLVGLLPYFGYVFLFIAPTRVVTRIEQHASRAMSRVARRGPSAVLRARTHVISDIDHLGAMVSNAVEGQDKPMAVASLQALADIAVHSIATKKKTTLPPEWFDCHAMAADDHDFVALHGQVLDSIVRRRTWVEMKVLRQFHSTSVACLNRLADINHLAAIHTRHVAEVALTHGDDASFDLALRHLNTFLRASINAQDIRSAYNVFNEYRLLGKALLASAYPNRVVALFRHVVFYAQLGFQRSLPFVLETAAYDLGVLIEQSHAAGATFHNKLLALYLEMDREPESGMRTQEEALRGVRKAQVMLATYYLHTGHVDLAKRIYQDMRDERPERLASIREELGAIVEPEYWEVTDRGVNFDYLPPERRAWLDTFFDWFNPSEATVTTSASTTG